MRCRQMRDEQLFSKFQKFFTVCAQHHCKKPPSIGWLRGGVGTGINALMKTIRALRGYLLTSVR